MKAILILLLVAMSCGCKDWAPVQQIRQKLADREYERWERIIKTTDSAEDLFNAAYHIRYYFPEEFERIGAEKSYRFLISKLQSSDPEERDNAASCLRWFKYGDRDKQLIEAYKKENVADVKSGLLFAMGNTNSSPEVVSFLTRILEGTDKEARWSAARSLSIIDLAGTDELLSRFKEDHDSEVREEVAFHFEEKEKQIDLSPDEVSKLIALATQLLASDDSDRELQIGVLPAEIAKRAVKEARVYQGVIIVRLLDPNGGIIVSPVGTDGSPAIPNCWVSPTGFKGILKFEAMNY